MSVSVALSARTFTVRADLDLDLVAVDLGHLADQAPPVTTNRPS
jgi:hypothetical protein